MNKLKTIAFIILFVCFMIMPSVLQAGWFDRGSDQLREQLQSTEAQLTQQQSTSDYWQGLAVILGLGCIVFLIIGTSIGSKVRNQSSQSLYQPESFLNPDER